MSELRKNIDLVYTYFYGRYYGKDSYVFQPTQNEEKTLLNFERRLLKKQDAFYYDLTWFFNYILFQFHYWSDRKTTMGSGWVCVNWVFGEVAFKRFSSSNPNWIYFAAQWAKNYSLELTDLIQDHHIVDKKLLFSFFEQEKRRYSGENRQLAYCSQFTNMYDPASSVCKPCSFAKTCQSLKEDVFL